MKNRPFLVPVVLAAAIACLAASPVHAQNQNPDQGQQRVMDLTNQARAQAGLPPLKWDPALAAAAYTHDQRMVQEGPISHRYGGEPDLPERASTAGARFSLVEENIAVASSPDQVHDLWMHSQGHHDNLMNPKIDSIGVALIPSRGVLYAVADYSQGVASMTQSQAESKIGQILTGRGLTLSSDPAVVAGARQYCGLDDTQSGSNLGLHAHFMMRWQSSDIARIPPELESRLASGAFHTAAVGACDPKSSGGPSQPAFTAYRVAVLLF